MNILVGRSRRRLFSPNLTSTVTRAEPSLFCGLLIIERVGGIGCVQWVQGSSKYASREHWLVFLGESKRNGSHYKEEGDVVHGGREV